MTGNWTHICKWCNISILVQSDRLVGMVRWARAWPLKATFKVVCLIKRKRRPEGLFVVCSFRLFSSSLFSSSARLSSSLLTFYSFLPHALIEICIPTLTVLHLPPVYTLCNIYVPWYGNFWYLDTYTYLNIRCEFYAWIGILVVLKGIQSNLQSYQFLRWPEFWQKDFLYHYVILQYLYSFHHYYLVHTEYFRLFWPCQCYLFMPFFDCSGVLSNIARMCGFPKSTQAKAHKRTCLLLHCWQKWILSFKIMPN